MSRMGASTVSAIAACGALVVSIVVAVLFTRTQARGTAASGTKATFDLADARRPHVLVVVEDSTLVITNSGPEDYSNVKIDTYRSADATFKTPIRLLSLTESPFETGSLGPMKVSEIRRAPFERVEPDAGGLVRLELCCTTGAENLTTSATATIPGTPRPLELTAAAFVAALIPMLQREIVSVQPIEQFGLSTSRLLELLDNVARAVRTNGAPSHAVAASESQILATMAGWRGAIPGNRVVPWYANSDHLVPGEFALNCGPLSQLGDDTTRGRALRSLYMNGDQSAWCTDYAAGNADEKLLACDGDRWPSYAYVPIRAGGRTIGLVEVACRTRGMLSEPDVQSFELLGMLLAITHLQEVRQPEAHQHG